MARNINLNEWYLKVDPTKYPRILSIQKTNTGLFAIWWNICYSKIPNWIIQQALKLHLPMTDLGIVIENHF